MKAYELAEYLATNRPDGIHYRFACGNAAIMIRQQADRIAHLEMLVANRNEIIDKLDLTKPQTKELSDEEIYEIGKQYLTQYEDGLYDFAREIIKKASEK
jgi:hypothetical protein